MKIRSVEPQCPAEGVPGAPPAPRVVLPVREGGPSGLRRQSCGGVPGGSEDRVWGFTYTLACGQGTVRVEQVLEYNEDSGSTPPAGEVGSWRTDHHGK